MSTYATISLAGNLAKLPAKDLNTFTLEYPGARLRYTTMYMGVLVNFSVDMLGVM